MAIGILGAYGALNLTDVSQFLLASSVSTEASAPSPECCPSLRVRVALRIW
jgi:hypothetical protein